MLWKKEPWKDLYIDLFQDFRNSPLVQLMEYEEKCNLLLLKDNALAITYRKDGNDQFAQKNYEMAIEMYNKSLCFAENGTEHVGIAYANRSACFLSMKCYELCLENIKLAQQAHYPIYLMPKLEKRKMECLKLMKTTKDRNCFEPKLSHDADKNVPCFVDGLQIEHNNEFGKHIRTQRDLEMGQTAIIEEPFCFVLGKGNYKRCANCLMENKNEIPCENCTSAMYCSQNCLIAANASFHNDECQIITSCQTRGLDNDEYRIVLRTIIIALNIFPSIDYLMQAVESFLCHRAYNTNERNEPMVYLYRSFFNLDRGNVSRHERQEMNRRAFVIYRTILNCFTFREKFTTERSQRFLIHLLVHHGEVVSSNSVTLYEATKIIGMKMKDYHKEPYAIGIYLKSRHINRSCLPNLHRISFGNRVVFKVIRPIKKGEQLFVSFINFEIIRAKLILQKSFFNNCKCSMCTKNIRPFNQDDTMKSDESFKIVKAKSNKANVHRDQWDFVERHCITFLKKFDYAHPTEETILAENALIYLWDLQMTQN